MANKKFITSVLCAVAVLGLTAGFKAEANALSPVGSWQLTLTPSTSAASQHPTSGLITFTSDGTVIEEDLSKLAAVPSTSGHGIWQPAPVFGKLFVQIITLIGNTDGSLHAKRTLTLIITLNPTGDRFQGGYELLTQDTTGHVLMSSFGTCSGQLIPHPLLP